MFPIKVIYLFLSVLLLLCLSLSVSVGSVPIEFSIVWRTVFKMIIARSDATILTGDEMIVWLHRLPRALLSCIVGMGLAMTGVILQSTVKNPLADPHLLGVSAGASVGAVLSIILGVDVLFGDIATPVFAFCGGLMAFVAVLFIAGHNGRITPLRLVLAGVAVSFFSSSITSFLSIRSNDIAALKSIQFWLLGGVAGANWNQLLIPAVTVLACATLFLFVTKYLNVMSLGDEAAITLGINVLFFRGVVITTCALVTAVVVSVSGAIGFVGLVIPHAVRLLFGSDNDRVLPISVLMGGIFIVLCDLLARTILAPEELPIGIFTAFVGAPFFIWLLVKEKNAFS